MYKERNEMSENYPQQKTKTLIVFFSDCAVHWQPGCAPT